MRLILEGDRKPALTEKGLLVRHAVAERVHQLAAGVDGLVSRQPAKELIADVAQPVGDHEAAEPGLRCEQPFGIHVGGLHQLRGIDVERPVGQPEVTRVRVVLKREGPVGREPVGRHVFAGVEDPHAVVPAMVVPSLADARMDQEVGPVADGHGVAAGEQPREVVVAGIEGIPEARKSEADRRSLSGGGGGVHARMVPAGPRLQLLRSEGQVD